MSGQATERQLRCQECGLRLADYQNEIGAGLAVLEIKCRKCGYTNRVTLSPDSR